MRYLLWTLFLLISSLCFSQTSSQPKGKSFYLLDSIEPSALNDYDRHLMDSLLAIYHQTTNDTTRLNTLRIFAEGLSDQRLWPKYNRMLLEAVKDRNDSLGVFFRAQGLNNSGYELQYIRNDIAGAIRNYDSSYHLFKWLNMQDAMAAELNNLAYIYQHQGNIKKAIDLYGEANLIFEKRNNYYGLTSCLINLGDIYFKNNEIDLAERNFWKALVAAKKVGQPPVEASVYNQLGAIEKHKKNFLLAIYFFEKAYRIHERFDAYGKMATSELSWANCLDLETHKEQVLTKYGNILRNANLSGDFQVLSRAYNHASEVYYKAGKHSVAKVYADSAAYFAGKIGFPELIYNADLSLAKTLYQMKDYKRAYDFLLQAQVMNDSIYNDKNKSDVLKLEYKSDYEKQALVEKAKQEKKDALAAAKRRQTQRVIFLIAAAAVLISVFAIFAFINYRRARKAKIIIEQQKNQVEAQKEEITEQKNAIEEKQKEILDSIHYASRIQTATLADKEVWNRVSKEHFVLYMPKDIVSGDFYWAYNTVNNRSVFLLGDSTGHGVPGALMSILGISLLNEVVVENKIFKADMILNKLREKLIAALTKEGAGTAQDGMDMALCVWNKVDNTLEFAGANNDMWLMREGKIKEYKGDKMPVGKYVTMDKAFSSTTIQLQKGDIIYLSTDGFADQFGGPKGKKFKYKPMMDLLEKNYTESMEQQRALLKQDFSLWKGSFDQVDDVSLIGVRV